MRFVRVAEWDARRGTVVDIERCTKCCEGNNVNPALERRTITRYMTRWLALYPSDTPEAYAERIAAQRAEQEAANAERRAYHDDIAATQKKPKRKLAPLPRFRDWNGGNA